MSALSDIISTTLGKVVTDLGKSWEVRVRTNRPPTTPATFGPWQAISAVTVRDQENEEDEEQVYSRDRSINIRVPGDKPYRISDQFRDASGDIYVIVDILSSGYGSTIYNCAYNAERYAGKGGVE